MNKRLLGYGSWHRRRRLEHRPEVLTALVSDLGREAPDHTAITGDLTHLGTRDECREAADWLRRLGAPTDVTLVPGNHDTYVREPWPETLALWERYMVSDQHMAGSRAPYIFPSLRIRRDLALIGLNSARPSAPFLAVGTIGRRQRRALAQLLRETGARGLCRVMLIHHPPVPGSIKWRKRLTDSRELAAIIAECGVELVLHGHDHRACLDWFDTPAGRAPVIGVRSASALGRRPGHRAQYHLYRITSGNQGWHLQVSVREYGSNQDGFVEVEKWQCTLGGSP